MLKKIQQFFESHFVENGTGALDVEHQLNLAAAALLVEMIFQDDSADELEIVTVKKALTEQLGLSNQEADKLYELAEEEKNQATDYHQFTKLITEHYAQPKKILLIESLWRVAFADNILNKYEEHMVRRISDLIHVSHKDFIQAKHKIEAELA